MKIWRRAGTRFPALVNIAATATYTVDTNVAMAPVTAIVWNIGFVIIIIYLFRVAISGQYCDIFYEMPRRPVRRWLRLCQRSLFCDVSFHVIAI